MKRTPLVRRTPLKKRRSKPRRGQPTADEKSELRLFIYKLSGGLCELRLPGCKGGVLPYEGEVMRRWHLVHMRSKRRFGWPIEGPHRMRGGCYYCHIEMMHQKGMKPDDYGT